MASVSESLYIRIGGDQKIQELVDAFYDRVAQDPHLQPIFPDDLTETKRKQLMFLTQYLGGPPIYSQERGHPRLRARHMAFPITPTRANAWLQCMSEAMQEVQIGGDAGKEMFQRLVMTARHMVNTPDDEETENND